MTEIDPTKDPATVRTYYRMMIIRHITNTIAGLVLLIALLVWLIVWFKS